MTMPALQPVKSSNLKAVAFDPTGPTPVTEKTFETFEQVEGMNPCRKKPIIVHAMQINEPFRVNSMEGNYKQGKPGDYLMKGIEGELYICDRGIFERTYDWT